MDELFDRLNRSFGALPDLGDALLRELVLRLDLSEARLVLPGRRPMRIRRSGRVLTADEGGERRPAAPPAPPPPERPSVDDAVHAADRFEPLHPAPPATAARSPKADAASTGARLLLPLVYGDRALGDLDLLWRTEGERRRGAPPWLPALARQCAFLVNRYAVRDWTARRLGRPLLIVGLSRAMRRLEGLLEHAARSDLPVLLTGEFGTEKLPLAATIHHGGARRDGPFVQVNCAEPHAGPAEWFEQAEGGTLYLNGVDELPPRLQRQLPLHMRSHLGQWSPDGSAADVRIVAATMTDLRGRVRDGAFSRALLAELDMLSIAAPPLRERNGDIDALVAAALQRHGFRPEEKQSDVLMAACRAHRWPENLFELERVVTRLAVMTGARPIRREDIVLHAPWIVESEPGPDGPAGVREGAAAAPEPWGDERWLRCAIQRDPLELGRLHEGLARALIYLGDHYAEPVSLGQLARHAHVSESHLSFLFRTALDMPFKGVLTRLRIHAAKDILAGDGRRQITEVALSVGFADLSHFEKSFKRIVGHSPREFRRRAAGAAD